MSAPSDSDRRVARGGSGDTAGAWAAAAVVLALGALAFGLYGQIRAADLEDRVTQLEAQRRAAPTFEVTTTLAPIARVGATTHAGDAGGAVDDSTRAGIRQAFQSAYSAGTPADQRLSAIDDPEGVEAALKTALAGPFGQQASGISVVVSDITMVSETSAQVKYSILVAGQPQYADRVGAAVYFKGSWRVSRATFCTDLATVGARCTGS